jgi:hypothetical protein
VIINICKEEKEYETEAEGEDEKDWWSQLMDAEKLPRFEEPPPPDPVILERIILRSKDQLIQRVRDDLLALLRGEKKIEKNGKVRYSEFTFAKGGVMRVDSDSEISLLTLAEREMQVRLSRGRIQVNESEVSADFGLRVESPAASFKGKRATYEVIIDQDGSTEVRVYAGSLGVEGFEEEIEVKKPREVTVEEWKRRYRQRREEKKKKGWSPVLSAGDKLIISPEGSYTRSTFSIESESR